MFRLIDFITGIWTWVQNLINEYVLKPIIRFYDSVVTGLKTILQYIWVLPNAVRALLDNIQSKFIQILNIISSEISKLKTWTSDNILKPLSNIINSIKNEITQIWNKLNLIKNEFLKWYNDEFNKIHYLFTNLFVSIRNLFENYYKTILDFFDNIYTRVTAIIEKWLEKGFLTIFDKIGEFINDIW